ncbi:MAG TPA: phosphoribosyltransferase [Patescibacteria group bacterium]|jgi:hypoxanthine phosphoribosyltransferase|nr:phosphoribosyltransferase [Patescibacteria group bacterium]
MAIDYLLPSWDEYHSLARKLAAKILSDRIHIDEVVAISRGGLTLGHLLTDLLRVPISTFTIQSYTDIQSQGEVTITKPLATPLDRKIVLLVDDVADRGNTMVRAIEYLKMFTPKKIYTLTLYYKPHSVYKPDYFAKTTSAWISFPYEPSEMILNIFNSMHKEGKSNTEINKFLENLHFTKEQISFVKKFYVK